MRKAEQIVSVPFDLGAISLFHCGATPYKCNWGGGRRTKIAPYTQTLIFEVTIYAGDSYWRIDTAQTGKFLKHLRFYDDI